MKKFLCKGFVFILVLCILDILLNRGYYLNDAYHIRKFKSVPEQIQICNIGASHSEYGFCWDDFQDEFVCFNFGLSAQSHYYDSKVLRYYQDKLSKKCVVFIVVSYPMVLYKNETDYEEFESRNTRYYFFLPNKSIKKFSWMKKIKTTFIPFTYSRNDIYSLVTSYFKEPEDFVWLRTTTAAEIEEDVNRSYQILVDGSKKGKTLFSDESIDYIYDIIDCCTECDAMPILITPPFTRAYTEKVINDFPEYANGFKEIIHKIQMDTGVEYFDYSRDERFIDNTEFFLNSDHLNKNGAKEFTKIVMNEVARPYLNCDEAENEI